MLTAVNVGFCSINSNNGTENTRVILHMDNLRAPRQTKTHMALLISRADSELDSENREHDCPKVETCFFG